MATLDSKFAPVGLRTATWEVSEAHVISLRLHAITGERHVLHSGIVLLASESSMSKQNKWLGLSRAVRLPANSCAKRTTGG